MAECRYVEKQVRLITDIDIDLRARDISTITLYNRDKMCNDLAWGNYERSLVTALMIIEWTSPCVQVCLQVSVVEQKICSFNSCKSHFLVSLKYDFVMIKYLS